MKSLEAQEGDASTLKEIESKKTEINNLKNELYLLEGDKEKIKQECFEAADEAYENAINEHQKLVESCTNSTNRKAANQRTIASNDYVTRSAYADKGAPFKKVTREECCDFWNEKTSPNYTPRNHFSDNGVEGSFFSAHAEQQQVMLHHNNDMHTPIGITTQQCGQCRIAMRDYAKQNKKMLIAKDPKCYRLYNPDGTVEIYEYKKKRDGSVEIKKPILYCHRKPCSSSKVSVHRLCHLNVSLLHLNL